MSIMSEFPRNGESGITAGIDLAKTVIAAHTVDDNGKLLLVKPKVARKDLAEWCR